MWRRNDRINERDVPESQHTIFIRGLPGNMSTDEIREYFEKDFGSCSFDFVKVSPDRTKLYIAVRFDSKVVAKEVMDKFANEGELIGYRVELSWFRDIRRYLAHCAKQGIRPSRFRSGGSRDDMRGRGGGYRGRGRSRSRSRSKSVDSLDEFRDIENWHPHADSHSSQSKRSRSRSRSPERRNEERSRSHSVAESQEAHNRSRSRTAESRSRSRTRSPAHSSPHSERDKSLDYSDIAVKKERDVSHSPSPVIDKKSKDRKKKREKRQKRKHSPSPSPEEERNGGEDDMEASDGEVEPKGNRSLAPDTAVQQQQVMIGPKQPEKVQQPQLTATGFPPRQIVAAVVAANEANQQQQQAVPIPPKIDLRNSSIKLDLSEPNMETKFKPFGENSYEYQQNGNANLREEYAPKRSRMELSPPPPQLPIRNMPVATKVVPGINAGDHNGDSILPLATNNFKEIQRTILQDVRYCKAQEDEEDEEHLGGLRLSALSRKGMTEEKREEKLAKLVPELRERVSKKKRQLELSYRNDCETYGLVVKKLIAKDRAMEDRLKVALLETMKDLEKETMKTLDEFVEELTYMCA